MIKSASAGQTISRNLKQEQNHKYWSEMITKYHSSGQTQKQFCAEHGLSYTAFKNWAPRIKKHAAQKTDSVKFVEVKLNESTPATTLPTPTQPLLSEPPKNLDPSPPAQTSSQPDLQIQMPTNCVIIVPRGFDDETLRRVVKAVS